MSIIDDIKTVTSLIQKADNIELYAKVLDLQASAMQLLEQIDDLKVANKALKEKLSINNKLHYSNNAYWIEEDGKSEGPFCSKCWDANKLLIRHQDLGNGYYSCPNCNMTIEKYDHNTVNNSSSDFIEW